MACGINRPDPASLFNALKDRFSVDVLGGSAIIPETNEWYAVALVYGVQEEFFSIADQLSKESDPRTCCCENLYAMAARDGVFPAAPRGSEGYATFTGEADGWLPTSIGVLVGETSYQTVSKLPPKMPASGEITARIRSTSTGHATNLSTGADVTGRLTNAWTGLNETVTIRGGTMCGGTDAEDCETFRERYLERLRFKPRLRAADIEALILSWPCVTRICARNVSDCSPDAGQPCADGCMNALHYYVYFDDTFKGGLAPQCVIDEMNVWLFGENPGMGEGEADVGVCGALHTAVGVPIAVSIDGLDCRGAERKALVEERIGELFRSACASSTVTVNAIAATIIQVCGPSVTFGVTITPDSEDHCEVLVCGDVAMNCDYAPLLKCVTFTGCANEGCGG